MKTRQLGRSGLTVSEVGLGCNNFGGRLDLDGTREVIHAALDAAITLFDTADIYGNLGGSETMMGQVLRGKRDEIVLATKFGMNMQTGDVARGSRRYVRRAVEASLRRLQTDHIDLYQIHEPDANTPIEETLAALDELVREGKVRYIGSSNFAAWQLAEAELVARAQGRERFVSAQNLYSLLRREVEAELIPAAEHFGVGILPFYPLAAGLLTGKFRRGEAPPAGTRLAARPSEVETANFDLIEDLEAFSKSRGIGLTDLAFAWLLGNPNVSSVIAGATSAEQIRANVAAGSHRLDSDSMEEIRGILDRYAA
ncbi:MAG: aldo/keto reductase [Actinomycetota bacterium]|nr:aldo/keto reductase [Actinomycetota bacterium]